jgi:hypothetical protein
MKLGAPADHRRPDSVGLSAQTEAALKAEGAL